MLLLTKTKLAIVWLSRPAEQNSQKIENTQRAIEGIMSVKLGILGRLSKGSVFSPVLCVITYEFYWLLIKCLVSRAQNNIQGNSRVDFTHWGDNSVGRVSDCKSGGRVFDPRLSLFFLSSDILFFCKSQWWVVCNCE